MGLGYLPVSKKPQQGDAEFKRKLQEVGALPDADSAKDDSKQEAGEGIDVIICV